MSGVPGQSNFGDFEKGSYMYKEYICGNNVLKSSELQHSIHCHIGPKALDTKRQRRPSSFVCLLRDMVGQPPKNQCLSANPNLQPDKDPCSKHCENSAQLCLTIIFSSRPTKMTFRTLLSSRLLYGLARSTYLVRSLTPKSRLGAGNIAKNGFRTTKFRGFQSTAFRAFPAPQEGIIQFSSAY